MGSWTNATSLPPDLPRPPTASPGGLLRPVDALRHIELDRIAPPAELSPWIEHLWSVRWSLPPGSTYRSQVLTHPALHLTVEWGGDRRHGHTMPASLVHGVVTRTFTVDLEGTGAVLGMRFRPGGFGAFTGQPVATWTDRVVRAHEVFGPSADQLTAMLIDADDLGARAELLSRYLGNRLPPPDPTYDRVLGVVRRMLDDRTLTSVQAVTAACATSPRTLQRQFRRYVGVGPKWVLQRFRLHDAVKLIDDGQVDDLAGLATRLGWYDQAHFSRDFADAVGMAPGQYLARARAERAADR